MPPEAFQAQEPNIRRRARTGYGAPERWRYSLRPRGGEWLVDRDEAEAGGIFTTLASAIRFVNDDLDTVIANVHPENGS